jgi:hypothetical protein
MRSIPAADRTYLKNPITPQWLPARFGIARLKQPVGFWLGIFEAIQLG